MPAGHCGKYRLNFSSQMFWLLIDQRVVAAYAKIDNAVLLEQG
jgi:predicted ester cyclase